MKVMTATILDPTHLELIEPLPTKPGEAIQISILDADKTEEQDWKKESEEQFLKAYSDQDSIYDQL